MGGKGWGVRRIRHAGWGGRCGAGRCPTRPCPHSNLPLCPYPTCPPLICPCPAPASSCQSLPLSLFCPGPILLCPQPHPVCVLLSVPFYLPLFSCLAPSCLSPLHLAPILPIRVHVLPVPVSILPILPCTHPVCPHPASPHTKHSTRLECEVPRLGPSCIFLEQGQLRWDFPSIDWISHVLGEFYLTTARGCEVTVTVGMLQPVPYGAE